MAFYQRMSKNILQSSSVSKQLRIIILNKSFPRKKMELKIQIWIRILTRIQVRLRFQIKIKARTKLKTKFTSTKKHINHIIQTTVKKLHHQRIRKEVSFICKNRLTKRFTTLTRCKKQIILKTKLNSNSTTIKSFTINSRKN